MKTLHQEWTNYRDAMYPGGVPAIQNKETHQAFVAGALCVKSALVELAQMPSGQAEVALRKLYREIDEATNSLVQLAKDRN